ncbi:MarR family transcriptional regulator [Methylocystis bryophila]|uniref:Uncharacterized protein n=1 Tax=Methylocystis bryophila TaxID=655015 RepID=A0A1W6MW56_9HYPH|nr:MarR family transcriptional regulator [Methylocystis bryophila]ARN81840.1 hypothetical protein B1812_12955 [Methylocystis bryophila]BDV37913.1 hypothetical protein DSM21852_11660 [Methylocystis bryophila]
MAEGEESGGLWLSISALAEAKGVTQQAISKRVARLKAHGLLQTRAGSRGAIEINVAQFDRATKETTDLARSTSHMRAPAAAAIPTEDPDAPIYTREQARKAAYTADLAKLELDERTGKLIHVAEVEVAATRAAEMIVSHYNTLIGKAEEHAGIVAAEGAVGLRRAYREFVQDQREKIARGLLALGHEGEEILE